MAPDNVSQSTLEETLARALVFWRAAGTTPVIRAILAKYGYTDEEHTTGWDLAHKVSGFTPGRVASLGTPVDANVVKALTEVGGECALRQDAR